MPLGPQKAAGNATRTTGSSGKCHQDHRKLQAMPPGPCETASKATTTTESCRQCNQDHAKQQAMPPGPHNAASRTGQEQQAHPHLQALTQTCCKKKKEKEKEEQGFVPKPFVSGPPGAKETKKGFTAVKWRLAGAHQEQSLNPSPSPNTSLGHAVLWLCHTQ